ncbi:MAG: FAD-dependent monooxygenase [Polyangiaceae bacterium]|jgi:2-polyprenyl-6-methoxyphenol hydroxylase-like FAD-dependent oxidoreductase
MPKGEFVNYKKRGLDNFHADIGHLEPRFAALVKEHVTTWSQVTLLDIFTANVDHWSVDGLLLIGDAAHTCSPILGQGVNLALQDAVDLAPILARLLRDEGVPLVRAAHLASFEKKRKGDVHFIQQFQNRNEFLLSLGAGIGAFMRRALYRVMNVLPRKHRILTKIALGMRTIRKSLPPGPSPAAEEGEADRENAWATKQH